MEHVGDVVDLSSGGLHLDPPYPEGCLDRVLEENSPDYLHARDEVAGLDLRAVVNAVLVEPPPSGDVEEVEYEAEPPVCDYGDSEGEEVVREPVEDCGARSVVEGRVGREVVQLVGVEERRGVRGIHVGVSGNVLRVLTLA